MDAGQKKTKMIDIAVWRNGDGVVNVRSSVFEELSLEGLEVALVSVFGNFMRLFKGNLKSRDNASACASSFATFWAMVASDMYDEMLAVLLDGRSQEEQKEAMRAFMRELDKAFAEAVPPFRPTVQ